MTSGMFPANVQIFVRFELVVSLIMRIIN